MSKAKILTKQIAERFLKDEDSVDLQRFTSIEDAAAQALAQHKGDLYLKGLLAGETDELVHKTAKLVAKHHAKTHRGAINT